MRITDILQPVARREDYTRKKCEISLVLKVRVSQKQRVDSGTGGKRAQNGKWDGQKGVR